MVVQNREVGYVVDSGPLLCLGASALLRSEVIARHRGQFHWVAAVREELKRIGDLRDHRSSAANAVSGRHSGWLQRCVSFSQVDQIDLEPVFERLRELAKLKRSPDDGDGFAHPNANLGEAQSIVHAKRRQFFVLTNDRDALKVSDETGVPAMTTVGFARGMVGAGARVDVLARELLDIQAKNIHLGVRIKGQLDLMPRKRP